MTPKLPHYTVEAMARVRCHTVAENETEAAQIVNDWLEDNLWIEGDTLLDFELLEVRVDLTN